MTRIPRAAVISFLGAIAAAMPTMVWAEAPAINHDAVGCIVVDKFPRLEARFDPAENVSRGRLRFRPTGGAHWYSVPMTKETEAFVGVLPKPTPKLKSLDYYVEVTATDFATGRTAEYAPEVVSGLGACQGDKVTAGSLGSATIILEVPAGAPAVPAGFSSVGIVSATAAATAAAGVVAGGGSGLSGAAIAIAGVAAASAAAGVIVAGGGGADEPPPASINLSGRWVGTEMNQTTPGPPACGPEICNGQEMWIISHSGETFTANASDLGQACTYATCPPHVHLTRQYTITGNARNGQIGWPGLPGCSGGSFVGTYTASTITARAVGDCGTLTFSVMHTLVKE